MSHPAAHQQRIVAAMLRVIAGQLVKLAASLETEYGGTQPRNAKTPKTPADYRERLKRLCP